MPCVEFSPLFIAKYIEKSNQVSIPFLSPPLTFLEFESTGPQVYSSHKTMAAPT